MTKPHILVTEHLGLRALDILRADADLEAYDLLSEEDFRERLGSADAVIIRSAHKLRASHFDRAPRLKVAARAGAGVDNIDLTEATQRGVLVINTPGANAVAAAEHTLGLLLALMRRIPEADRHVRGGGWDRQAFFGSELLGRRLGIIGIGRVGSRVAQRARGFGMKPYAYDPFLSPEVIRERGAEPVAELTDLISVADVLTLHTPKNGPRLGLVELSHLPAGAVVLNVARGGLIDEDALAKLLQEGHVAGAALDVFTQEPPAPDNPLLRHPRVVVTCHLGGSTFEAQSAIGEQVARSVLDALNGQVPVGAVNLPPSGELQDPGLLVTLGRAAGQLLALSGSRGQRLFVEAAVSGPEAPRELVAHAVALGFLQAAGDERANLISSLTVAADRGMAVTAVAPLHEAGVDGPVRIRAWFDREADLGVELFHNGGVRLKRLWGAHFDLALSPFLLATRHHDRPGMVGAMGSILGVAGVNIATLELGRNAPGGEAVMLVGLDSAVPPGPLSQLRAMQGMRQVESLTLTALIAEGSHAI